MNQINIKSELSDNFRDNVIMLCKSIKEFKNTYYEGKEVFYKVNIGLNNLYRYFIIAYIDNSRIQYYFSKFIDDDEELNILDEVNKYKVLTESDKNRELLEKLIPAYRKANNTLKKHIEKWNQQVKRRSN